MSSRRGAIRFLKVAAALLAVWIVFFVLEAIMSASMSTNPSGSLRALFEIDIAIDEASAKVRDMGPMGPGDSDPEVPGSAFARPA